MNRNIALSCSLALVVAAAGHARAGVSGETGMEAPPPFKATLTREQVRSELQRYRAAGVDPWADHYNPLTGFRSTRTRREVIDEFLADRDYVAAQAGELGAFMQVARKQPSHPAGMQVAGDR